MQKPSSGILCNIEHVDIESDILLSDTLDIWSVNCNFTIPTDVEFVVVSNAHCLIDTVLLTTLSLLLVLGTQLIN